MCCACISKKISTPNHHVCGPTIFHRFPFSVAPSPHSTSTPCSPSTCPGQERPTDGATFRAQRGSASPAASLLPEGVFGFARFAQPSEAARAHCRYDVWWNIAAFLLLNFWCTINLMRNFVGQINKVSTPTFWLWTIFAEKLCTWKHSYVNLW